MPPRDPYDREAFETHALQAVPARMTLRAIDDEIDALDERLYRMVESRRQPLSFRVIFWPIAGFSTVILSAGAFLVWPNTLSLVGIFIGAGVGMHDLASVLDHLRRTRRTDAAYRRLRRRKDDLVRERRVRTETG